MADTTRDDPDVSSIAEMRALPVASQIPLENLPAIPDPAHGEDGGEAHDIARASTPQTKGPSDGDGGAKNWDALANVVVSQDPEEDQDGFNVTPTVTPITGQGPPSFAQSEFYTVNFIRIPTILALIIELPVHVDCPSSTP
jgi:hypothetical protein